MHPSAQRVQNVLIELGFDGAVIEHESTTRTAVEAAQAVGCDVGQIVKSLVFQLEESGEAVLILVSGVNRVHEKRLGRLIGGKLARMEADAVHDITGYAIGGIPPLGHKTPLKTYIDEDLIQYSELWAAAGTANAVFRVSPNDLVRLSGGTILCVK